MPQPFFPRGALPGSLLLGSIEEFAKQIGEADLFNAFPKVPQSIRESEAFARTLASEVWMKVSRKGTVRAGQASFTTKHRGRVELNSKLFTCGTAQDIRETFLHESAHLLANLYYKHKCNHDWRWVRMARLLGGNGDRCHSYSYLISQKRPKKLTYACVTCRQKYHRARRLDTVRLRCGRCRGFLRLVEE